MAYIECLGGSGGSGGSGINYSTDEQVIGTWIDGKPIYQKTFNINVTLSGSAWAWYDTGVTASDYDMEYILDAEVIRDDNTFHNVLSFSLTQVNNHISFNSYWSGTVITRMTLRYTKTTD